MRAPLSAYFRMVTYMTDLPVLLLPPGQGTLLLRPRNGQRSPKAFPARSPSRRPRQSPSDGPDGKPGRGWVIAVGTTQASAPLRPLRPLCAPRAGDDPAQAFPQSYPLRVISSA